MTTNRYLVTLLSVQLRAAAETARRLGKYETAAWLIEVADALEKHHKDDFIE